MASSGRWIGNVFLKCSPNDTPERLVGAALKAAVASRTTVWEVATARVAIPVRWSDQSASFYNAGSLAHCLQSSNLVSSLPNSTMSLATAHLRVARPTNNIPALLPFYRDGLGFQILLTFSGHSGFDGVLLGHKGSGYHLEFTSNAEHDAGRAPTSDNLLVFYLPDDEEYRTALGRMDRAGFRAVASFNPYWDRQGKTYEDADGYRVVLANMSSPV